MYTINLRGDQAGALFSRFVLFAVVAALFGVLFTACDELEYRPSAVGPDDEIAVVISGDHWEGEVGDVVREELGTFVYTLPVPERMFDLRHMEIHTEDDLDQIRRRKNVVFVAPITDTTNEAQMIQSSLSPDARQAIEEGNSVVAPRRDLWRRNQQIYFVTADNTDRLQEAMRSNGHAMRDTLGTLVRDRKHRNMFERGRQTNLEQELMDRHDFAVNVQHDYLIAQDTTFDDSGFIWLRRILQDTWRSLFVYYEEDADPATITPEWITETRDSVAQAHIEGNIGGFPRTDYRRELEAVEEDFKGRYGFTTRGLWHMVDVLDDGSLDHYGGGGPYVNYTFYDEDSGRIYMLDGMVFAPQFDKLDFLRQMEVISHTFRTRHDAQPGDPALADD